MIPEPKSNVHPPPTPIREAVEPVLYLLTVEPTTAYLGAARMAGRYVKKTRAVRLRVIRCEPPIPLPSLLMGHADVTESTLLLELDPDVPDAITEWAKIIGLGDIELQKVTAEDAQQQLNFIASLRVDPRKPRAAIPDPLHLVGFWNPLTQPPSTATVSKHGGAYRYEIVGDVYPRDIWQAVRHVNRKGSLGVENEIDWSTEGVVRGASVVLSLDQEDDVLVRWVADLITDGLFRITKIGAHLPCQQLRKFRKGANRRIRLKAAVKFYLAGVGKRNVEVNPAVRRRSLLGRRKRFPGYRQHPSPGYSSATFPTLFLPTGSKQPPKLDNVAADAAGVLADGFCTCW